MKMLIAKRLALLPFVALAVATIVFFVLRVVPGNAADVLAQQATYGQKQQIIKSLGLNQSVFEQYWIFLKGLAHLNFGFSFYSGDSRRPPALGRHFR